MRSGEICGFFASHTPSKALILGVMSMRHPMNSRSIKKKRPLLRTLTILAVAFTTLATNAQKKDHTMEPQVFYRTVKVDGLSIFYAKRGQKTLPPFSCCTVFHRRRGCFSR